MVPDVIAGLPEPKAGNLTIYLYGPGVGESLVLAMPDGKWIVVDVFERAGCNFPLAVLETFGVEAIDLLVVTHPDLDHIRGLPRLVATCDVRELWRYPSRTKRDILAALCRKIPENERLSELSESLKAMEGLERKNRCFELSLGPLGGSWPNSKTYELTCVAPCPADLNQNRQEIAKLADWSEKNKRPVLSRSWERFLLGRSKGLDGKGNPVSLALSLRWGELGVLLAGDVEAPRSPHRGWNGVREVLREQGRLDLLERMRVVKVAHHGSRGAYSEPIWDLHTSGGPISLAAITPYSRGKQLPSRSTLKLLRKRSSQLAMSSRQPTPGGWSDVAAAGWTVNPPPAAPPSGSWLAVDLDSGGAVTVTPGSEARRFE